MHRAIGWVSQQRGDEGVHAEARDSGQQGHQQNDQYMTIAEDRQLLAQGTGGGGWQCRELQQQTEERH
ncbi:hypothetical protein D3C80_1966750 [compost metagenome]